MSIQERFRATRCRGTPCAGDQRRHAAALKLDAFGDGLIQAVERLTLNGTFGQGFFIGLLFLGALLLNLERERFWCRSVCPTGALLGLLSRWNLFKVKVDEARCTKCNLCSTHCQTQASPFPNKEWKSSECVYCELQEDVLAVPLSVSDGVLAVPSEPGLGVEVDRGKLERLQVR